MTTDVKQALEVAAASPDPKVRSLALRRVKIDEEAKTLDGFFALYSDEATQNAPAPVVARASKKAKISSTGTFQTEEGRVKSTEFVTMVNQVIAASGLPRGTGEIFDLLKSSHPAECPKSQASLRVRLTVRPDLIQKVGNRGFWPADLSLPEGSNV